MRQIYLVDSVGSTFTFNHLTNSYITELEGLGIERDNSYLNFDGTYKLAKREHSMGQIAGKIIFLDGYKGYTNFINFLKRNNGELRLFYEADNLKYTFVELVSLTKTELESGVLQCKVTFDKLSLWLRRLTNTIDVNESTQNKVYPYKFPFTYSVSYNGSINVVNSGCMKAPIKIEITGKTKNPVVQVLKNEEVITQMRLVLETSNTTDVIVVNAIPTEQEMTLTSNGKVTDIYGNQDFNYDNFLYLPVGYYKIKFDAGVSEKTKCKITYLEEYEGN